MKSFFKREPYRNKKILQSARGQECTMNSPNCNHDPSTVVFCHSNYQSDGKGAGVKADDCFGFFGCSGCHHWYDELYWNKEEKFEYFHRAMKRTWRKLLDMEVLK